MNYNYLQQGGLTSLPTNPVIKGQRHNLSYITPREAQLLRGYGGGITPDGGQSYGPGGIPSFVVGGETSANFGGGDVAGYGPSQGQGLGVQGVSAGTGSTSGGANPGGIGVPPGQTPAEVDVSDRLSKQLNQICLLYTSPSPRDS